MQANAVVFTAPNTVEYRAVTCPEPGPRDVVVRVIHSWISNGTEGSFLRGERIAGDTPYRPGDPWPFPMVAGYQKIGVAEWVGDAVTDITVGETLFAALGKIEGMFSPWAGQVSPSVSPREQIWKIPAGVDPLACSGLVLTQVGYNCGVRAPISVGEGAVVIGDGMVGQWAAQTLAWRGADVVLVGRHEERLALFGDGPLRCCVNERRQDWVQVVRQRFPTGVQVMELPLIVPQIRLIVILNVIGSLQSFGWQLLVTRGGPNNATTVPAWEMYQSAMTEGRFGVASAIGVVLFLLIFILTLINQSYIRSNVEYQAD